MARFEIGIPSRETAIQRAVYYKILASNGIPISSRVADNLATTIADLYRAGVRDENELLHRATAVHAVNQRLDWSALVKA